MIEKYNLEAITNFIQSKFTDLDKAFNDADLERKRVLLCSIYPKGLRWDYPGYSNTHMSPFYQCFLDIQNGKVAIGASIDTFLKLLYEIWDKPESLPKAPNFDTPAPEPETIIY